MIGLLKSNPNAAVSAVGTGIAELVIYLLDRYAHVHLSGPYQLLVAGCVSSGLLFLGRNGIEGVIRLVVRGNGATPPPPPPAASK